MAQPGLDRHRSRLAAPEGRTGRSEEAQPGRGVRPCEAIDTRPAPINGPRTREKPRRKKAPRGCSNTTRGAIPHLKQPGGRSMSHGTGRHRRRRRGWVSSARWAVGAALAAIIGVGSEPPPSAQPEVRKPPPRREPLNPGPSRSEREPEWTRHYNEARRTHTERTQALITEDREEAAPDASIELPEFGWCVDDDGARAVRPYLVAHEYRQRDQRRRAAPHAPRRVKPAPSVPARAAAPGTSGEWDELAGLIRQWEAQRVPVA